MQIESLSLFLAVVESKSITKAAQKLYMTPQGASSAIRVLEKQLDTKLFERRASSLEITREGAAVAKEAKRVVDAYRRLQSVAAMQSSERRASPVLNVVASPFITQTLASVIEEYAHVHQDDVVVNIVEQNAYEIARIDFADDPGTIYLLDLPMDLGIVETNYSETFLDNVLAIDGYYEPFLLSSFMLRCSENSIYVSRKAVRWTELEKDRIACHNDAFLETIINHYVKRPKGATIGMKTIDIDILDAAIEHYGMVGLYGSFPVLFRERSHQPSEGVAVELKPRVSFVSGALCAYENTQAQNFVRYIRRLLNQSYGEYMRKNDPAAFFKKNSARRNRP